jgi:hypothetical protein
MPSFLEINIDLKRGYLAPDLTVRREIHGSGHKPIAE